MSDLPNSKESGSVSARPMRKLVRRGIIRALICLITLVCLFYAVENWRGARAWQRERQAYESRGQSLDWRTFIPPKVADVDNFIAYPGMAEIFVRLPETNNTTFGFNNGKARLIEIPKLSPMTMMSAYASRSIPIPMDELRALPVRHTNHFSISEAQAKLPPISNALVFTNATLVNMVTVLGRQAGWEINATIDSPQSSFAPDSFDWTVPAGTRPVAAFTNLLHHFDLVAEPGMTTGELRVSRKPSLEGLLSLYEPYEEVFDSIKKASARPGTWFPGDYRESFRCPMPNFISYRLLAQQLALRARLYLLLGDSPKALEEVRLLVRLTRSLDYGQPYLFASMIKVALSGLCLETVRNGLEAGSWSDAQLVELQGQLQQMDLMRPYVRSLQTETASVVSPLENFTTIQLARTVFQSIAWREEIKKPLWWAIWLGPQGWRDQNMANYAHFSARFQESFDTRAGWLNPIMIDQVFAEELNLLERTSPYVFAVAQYVPNLLRASQVMALREVQLRQAAVALALSRFHHRTGEYPKELSALVPEYLAAIPVDVIDGKPLRYRREATGYTLYSLGWNAVDDGGIPAPSKSPPQQSDSVLNINDYATGDWVWPQPVGPMPAAGK